MRMQQMGFNVDLQSGDQYDVLESIQKTSISLLNFMSPFVCWEIHNFSIQTIGLLEHRDKFRYRVNVHVLFDTDDDQLTAFVNKDLF